MTDNKHTSFRLKLWTGIAALAAIVVPVLLTYAQSTSTMYTDGANFGIGTTGPVQKLQVVGTVAATAFSGDGSALTNISAGGWTDGGTNVYTSATTDNVGIGTWAANGKLIVMGGNVGIGTTAPSEQVHIYKSENVYAPRLILENANPVGDQGDSVLRLLTRNSKYDIAVNDDNDLFFIADKNANIIRLGINGNGEVGLGGNITSANLDGSTMVVESSGNVGIGTTVSSSLLHVYKNANSALELIIENASAAGFLGDTKLKLNTRSSGFSIGVNDETDHMHIEDTSAGAIRFGIDGTGNVGLGGSMNWNTFSGSTIYARTGGNVGIGTTMPLSKLVVNGGVGIGTTTLSSFIGTAAPVGGLIVEKNVGIGTTSPVGALTVMNGNVGIGTWSVDGISGALIIANNAGNVGIGTIRPGTKLDVNGTVRATAFSGDGSGLTGISAGGWTDGGTNVYTSTTTDNVGIGTTTPTAALLVENAGTQESFQINDQVLDGSPFIIFADGNVGIGTTTATRKVSLVASSASASMSVRNTDTTGWSSILFSDSSSTIVGGVGYGNASASIYPGMFYIEATAKDIGFFTAAGTEERMRIVDSSGNIGIGTSTPASKLTLAGNMSLGTTLPYRTIAAPTDGMIVEGNVGIGTWSAVNAGFTLNRQVGATFALFTSGTDNDALGFIGGAGGNDASVTYNTFWDGSGWKSVGAGYSGFTGYDADGGDYYIYTTTSSVAAGASVTTLTSRMYINEIGNVGISTLTPVGALTVMNGNVGIGTWSPTQRLQVVGTVAATAFSGDGSALTGISAGGWTDGGTNVYTSTTTDNVGIGTTTPTAALLVENAGTQDSFRVNDSVVDGSPFIIDAAGAVGIGTAAPAVLLQLHTATGSFPKMRFSAADVTLPSYAGSNSIGDVSATNTFGQIRNRINGTAVQTGGMLVQGFTGSGVNNFYPLHLVGTHGGTAPTTAAVTISGQKWNGGNNRAALTSTTPVLDVENNYDTAATTGLLFRIMGDGNVGIGTTSPVGALTVMNGNVGIGTWSPTSRLQVVGTVAATAFSGDGSALTGISAGGWTDGGTNVYASTTTDNVGVGTTTPTAALLVENAGTQDSFRVNDSVVDGSPFIIDAAGAVGIGTSDPSSPLHINSTSSVVYLTIDNRNGGATNGALIDFEKNGATRWQVGVDIYAAGTNELSMYDNFSGRKPFQITESGDVRLGGTDSYSNTQAVTILQAGNVGVGTFNPVNKLAVMGNIGIGTTTPYRFIAGPNNGMAIEGNVGIGTWAADNGKLIVMGGNVGIGTTKPQQDFHVRNDQDAGTGIVAHNQTNSANALASLDVASSTSEGVFIAFPANHTLYGTQFADRVAFLANNAPGYVSSGLDIGAIDTNADIRFYTGGSAVSNERLRILSGGNVGIGTTTPVGALTVMNGNVGIGTFSPSSRFEVLGAMGTSVVSTAGNYTATVNDSVIVVDASGGSVTVTLPAAAAAKGRIYHIKKTDASANSIVIDGNASETIDGALTLATTTQYHSFTLVCDGSNWWLI
jgi:hypothetical protein